MVDISREIFNSLKEYERLLIKWNKSLNLISKDSVADLWNRHIVDSMQLYKYIGRDARLIDVGSGAGFPGVILSILGVRNVTLIESDIKKSIFLLRSSKISSNTIDIANLRVEDFKSTCDILTSRAFASIEDIFNYTRNIIVRDKYLLLKGKNYLNEIDSARKKWDFNCLIYDSITSGEGKILEIRDLWQKQ